MWRALSWLWSEVQGLHITGIMTQIRVKEVMVWRALGWLRSAGQRTAHHCGIMMHISRVKLKAVMVWRTLSRL